MCELVTGITVQNDTKFIRTGMQAYRSVVCWSRDPDAIILICISTLAPENLIADRILRQLVCCACTLLLTFFSSRNYLASLEGRVILRSK